MNKRISIIIPVLNEAAEIEARLQALQAVRPFAEIWVVDGGSQDDTYQRALPLVDGVLRSAPGRAIQMNTGARAAQGEQLLFLHCDTTLPEVQHWYSAVLQADWGRFDVIIAGNHVAFPVISTLMNVRSRLTGVATGDQAMFVRRSLFWEAGGFPEQPLMEDIALSARLKAYAKPRCLPVRVTTSGRRWLKHGVFKTILLMWGLRLAYWLGVPPERLAHYYGYSSKA